MSERLPRIVLVRHGETEWSATGRHTSLTDVALTERGEADARRLAAGLQGREFALVLTSPLLRARRTCELAGFGDAAVVDPDLVEFRYGAYEGLTTAEIRRRRPGWDVFRDGCPEGDSPQDVAARTDRVVGRLREAGGDVLVFAHGHILRGLAVRWVGLEIHAASRLALTTASVSILSFDHDCGEPNIRVWNDEDFRGSPP
ncbi:histidine phosphatase family protein [Paludisphaera mucosa]|uniref:Histidine phosphatase family protein n=1 Tax=Paludisphaera mucosa TaxID=3030827 RepID=A0ABT6FCD8_9BACT|nr:histidine phosphatase family protein [Paludisphaera mucosa]MDG3005258.1 histidine phosphatase family protein [Paludisphaera mucosa]